MEKAKIVGERPLFVDDYYSFLESLTEQELEDLIEAVQLELNRSNRKELRQYLNNQRNDLYTFLF